MVRMITSGILDLIGAARPSIADPFLPKKIEEGRLEDIRECIGCNICVSGDFTMSPIRCTQNPSMGEEWRRGWHPERIRIRGERRRACWSSAAGQPGWRRRMMLGRRGYQVMLAEATDALGGRVAKEARLPGLSAWIRVLDYRASQLARDGNVEVAYNSRLDAEEVLEYGFDHVCIATGSRWRDDGVGRVHTYPLPLSHELPVMTPDDLMAGDLPAGEHVVLFDDDHYYMGGVLTELLIKEGRRVTLVTPSARVSEWADHTMEQERIQGRLMELGAELMLSHVLQESTDEGVRLTCSYTGRPAEIACDALVLVTARLPFDALSAGLAAAGDRVAEAGIRSVVTVGDAYAPGTIATAIWGGRRYAEELDGPPRTGDVVPFLREVVQLA